MNILMISTDAKVFQKDSQVRIRIEEYSKLCEKLSVIVFTKKESNFSAYQSDRLSLIPTNSKNRWKYIFDAINVVQDLKEKFSLVTTQDPFETGIVGWRIAKTRNIPLHVQLHTDFLNPYFKRSSFLNYIRVILGKYIIRRAAGIRVVSERIQQSLIKKLHISEKKIVVLPIFVDIQKYHNAVPQINLKERYVNYEFIVLMSSRLTEEKNIPLAIQGFDVISRKVPKMGLVIVGDGPEKAKLQKMIMAYDLQRKVVFESWSNNLASYFKTADVFLSTSNYEGYGLTLVEAAASGIPVITSDVGVVGEILNNDNAYIYKVGDLKGLISALVIARHEPQLSKEKAQKAYNQVVQKTYKNKEEYLELYKRQYDTIKPLP